MAGFNEIVGHEQIKEHLQNAIKMEKVSHAYIINGPKLSGKMMLQHFEAREDAYRSHHPSTAEMDIAVFRAHCAGKTALQISMDVPCSESTVYRALRRVQDFLSSQNYKHFL